MTGRALITINSVDDRNLARRWIERAPEGTRIMFAGPQRSLSQNARMWAMLTDITTQTLINGRRYGNEELKGAFMFALGHEVEFVQSLDGARFIPMGLSTSKLGKKEMSDLIEMMFAYGAENGVVWTDPQTVAYEQQLIEQAKPRLLTHQKESAA